jgi:hypothetical protein
LRTLNVCHRFGGNTKRFLDFARNDKFRYRASPGGIPKRMRIANPYSVAGSVHYLFLIRVLAIEMTKHE